MSWKFFPLFRRNILWVEVKVRSDSFRSVGTFCAIFLILSQNDRYDILYIYLSNSVTMSNTYTQLHIQFIFAVKYREALISKSWKEELHKYITGIFQQNKHKVLQINSMPDHIHILTGLHPTQSISSLVQNVKTESSKWIKNQKKCITPFAWQEGYAAFSYSKTHVDDVIRYIQNQEIHHQKQGFLDEYRQFLKLFEVPYDDDYIFKELE